MNWRKTAGMARKPHTPIHLGLWLIARGRTAAELARGTGINEGYISELISGKKKNPGIDKLSAISEWMGIPISSLFKKPPSPEVLSKLSPAHIEALGTLMEQYGIEDSPSGPKDRKSH